ncbi:MAG: flagellar basal body-associated FliL family protein [Pseudodesulfovibrio sp.]
MADEDVVQDDEKKGGMLKWIIILVVLIGLGVGGYFGYTMFLAGDSEDAASEEMADGEGEGDENLPLESLEGQMVPLPVFLVNLADPLGRRYLKLGLEVEVRDPEAVLALAKYEAKIKDVMLLLLSSKTYESLASMQAKMELKQEIVDRLNQILGKGSVLRVYITDMVVQ